MSVNLDNLLERILRIQPDAGPDDVRRFAPAFRDVGDQDILNRMVRMKQRIEARSKNKHQAKKN